MNTAAMEARIEAEKQRRIVRIFFLIWLIEECRASIGDGHE